MSFDQSINGYEVQSELGRGGMATVYLAHDNKFDTNVAIKVLNKEYVHNDNIRKRFLAEAKSMFKMSHPNIIKVTDLIDEGGTVAFVMEYIEGVTLKEYIDRKGKLKDDEIKTIFSQMLEAVGYVHEQNLVHRDIKPSNFMLDKNGKIKLMDFGIAKTLDASSSEYTQTGTGAQMGTPMYMSPEQITETKSVTAQSDIYSLGVVLWQMVTGQKPYDTKTLSNFQLQSRIVNETLPSTNTSWDAIIKIAAEKDIEKRLDSCFSFISNICSYENKTEQDCNTSLENQFHDEITRVENQVSTLSHLSQPNASIPPAVILINDMEFVWVQAGTFIFPFEDIDEGAELFCKNVTLTKGFYIGKYPITNNDWARLMGSNHSGSVCSPSGENPVNGVSWTDCEFFVNRLSQLTGKQFRLPTEAEWFFAAKGGVQSHDYIYSGSNHLAEIGWYGMQLSTRKKFELFKLGSKDEVVYKCNGNCLKPFPDVGLLKSNELGVFDMSGNVGEWTNDYWTDKYDETNDWIDPKGPKTGEYRILRGGSFMDSEEGCKIHKRNYQTPDSVFPWIGFRIVLNSF